MTGRRIGRWGKSMAKSCVGDRVGTGGRDRYGQGRAVPIYFHYQWDTSTIMRQLAEMHSHRPECSVDQHKARCDNEAKAPDPHTEPSPPCRELLPNRGNVDSWVNFPAHS